MTEVIVAGINFSEIQNTINSKQKELVKYVSQNIDFVKRTLDKVKAGDVSLMTKEIFHDLVVRLNGVYLVSKLGDIRLDIPWDREWDSLYSSFLEDGIMEFEDIIEQNGLEQYINELYQTFEVMEGSADQWYNSRCW